MKKMCKLTRLIIIALSMVLTSPFLSEIVISDAYSAPGGDSKGASRDGSDWAHLVPKN